ncbi:ferritin-like protein [Mesorhizobium sp. M1006]|uniref:ferritin-like domain-containing protein n=1 Tax=Mesorhizobium sp. M1006 TaxID=2957048 RepID=UPI00333D5C83
MDTLIPSRTSRNEKFSTDSDLELAMSPVLATSAIGRAVVAYDLPKVPGAQNALQEAGALLDMAAEIEHSLMVQYLYSGFAVVQSAAGQQPNKLLRDIAVEEMGHLLTVTNIRLLLGLEPYLRRQDESPQEGFDPFPFALEPLSADSLARYVAAESPSENAELAQGDKKASVISSLTGQLHNFRPVIILTVISEPRH